MADPKKCSSCGCDMTADSLGGHCPKCSPRLGQNEGPTNIGSAETMIMEPADNYSPEKKGDIIGRYKLLELIGTGGFGSVYAAEQKEPIRRRVALKIIKLG